MIYAIFSTVDEAFPGEWLEIDRRTDFIIEDVSERKYLFIFLALQTTFPHIIQQMYNTSGSRPRPKGNFMSYGKKRALKIDIQAS